MDQKCFMLLSRHTDEELTDFLQRKAESGWMLKGNRGNIFTFRREPYHGQRVCAVTFFSQVPDIPTIKQVRQYLPLVRKRGWDSICIGQPENIFDSRRHVFLKAGDPEVPLPGWDKEEMAKAAKRGRKTALRCLATGLIFVAFLLFVLTNDLLMVVTSTPYLLFGSVFVLLLAAALVLAAVAIVVGRRKKKGLPVGPRSYRWLDWASLCSSVMLLSLLLLLLADSLAGQRGSVGQRTTIGGDEVVLYSDQLPVTLEQLGGDTSGAYRTSRFLEGISPLAEYFYGFDESLGTTASDEVSFIRYTVFTSPVEWVREWVMFQGMEKLAVCRPDLAEEWQVDTVYSTDDQLSFAVMEGEQVLIFRSGFPLEEEALRLLLERLLVP